MSVWLTTVICIAGFIVLMICKSLYAIRQNRKDTDGKVWVFMRTFAGTKIDFLADYKVITEGRGFIVLPESKRKYLDSLKNRSSSEVTAPKRGRKPRNDELYGYVYDKWATVKSKWPSPHGIFSFESSEVYCIEYNEGDPYPIGLPKKYDEDGKPIPVLPIDVPAMLAYAQDADFQSTSIDILKQMDEGKAERVLSKFIHPFVHYFHILITTGIGILILYFLFQLTDKIDKISRGLGI